MSNFMEPPEPVVPPPVRPIPTPAKPGPHKPSAFPGILTGLGLGALLVGLGYGLSMTIEKKPDAGGGGSTNPPVTDVKPTPSDPAARVEGLATEVQGLVKRLDDIQRQVAALPPPAPVTDLKPIEAKLDALARRVDAPDAKAIDERIAKATATQTEALAKLSAQVSGLEKALASGKAELAALNDRLKSLTEAQHAPGVTPTPAAAAADADFAKAVDLFKKGQYGPARDAFGKLQQATPDDARVWYYSALSNGLATSSWEGETARLVTRGIELEKAGTPDTAKINAAFAEVSPSVKNWLDAYRARAR